MCFKMGNEILAIFICLKTQCAFRRQPLFLRANNRTCNQRLCPLLSQRKRKSLIAGFCSSQFLLSTKGETFSHVSAGFDYFSANRRKTAPTFSSRFVGFPSFLAHHRVNNHSYYFMKCHLWVSNSLSQSESTNAFTF